MGTVTKPRRVPQMPPHYNRAARGELGRDAFARAVVLDRAPTTCLKCVDGYLESRGAEVKCLNCGWAQLVRR